MALSFSTPYGRMYILATEKDPNGNTVYVCQIKKPTKEGMGLIHSMNIRFKIWAEKQVLDVPDAVKPFIDCNEWHFSNWSLPADGKTQSDYALIMDRNKIAIKIQASWRIFQKNLMQAENSIEK